MFSVRKVRSNVRANLGKFFAKDDKIQNDCDSCFLSINVHCDSVLFNNHVHFVTHNDTVASIEGMVGLRAEQVSLGKQQVVG